MAWEAADRLSDKIVDLLNAERQLPGFSPVQAIGGQMLAIMAMLETAEKIGMPPELARVKDAIQDCLRSMHAALKEPRTR